MLRVLEMESSAVMFGRRSRPCGRGGRADDWTDAGTKSWADSCPGVSADLSLAQSTRSFRPWISKSFRFLTAVAASSASENSAKA